MSEGLAQIMSYGRFASRDRSPLDKLVAAERYGYRHGTNQPKGEGWLGNIGTKEEPVTEYTVNVNGREIPTIIPGLGFSEVMAIRGSALKGTALPNSIVDKAAKFAEERNRNGLSQFKD